jgi:O-antigen/teichoic acid export membrane protein
VRHSTLATNNLVFLKKYFKKGGFVFNAGTLFAGNVSAQFVGVLLAPIITRLYLPEDFGVSAVIVAIIGVMSVISCMRYETAVVLPKTEEKAKNLVALCLILTLIISLVLLFTVPFMGERVELWVKMEGIGVFLYLVPLGVFAYGLELTLRFWFTRKKNFALIAKTRMITQLSTNGVKIMAGLLVGSSALWLVFGNIIGIFAIALIFAVTFLRNDYKQFKNSVTWREIREVAREYKSFPKYNSPTALMNNLSQNIPTFLFAYYFSAEFVGFYALAVRILKKPILLVSDSVRSVFLQRVAEMQSKGQSQRAHFMKTTLVLAAVGVIPFGIITIWGEWIFSFVFGEKWAIAGFYVRFLSPWLFLMLINPPATSVILVKQKLSNYLIFNVLLLSFRTIAIICGYFISADPWVAVALFSGVGFIANLMLIFYAYKLTGHYILREG